MAATAEHIMEIVLSAQKHSDMSVSILDYIARVFIYSHHSQARGGVSLEVGTRAGGSAKLFADLLSCSYDVMSVPPLITVDPYGAKPYYPASQITELAYDDTYYKDAKSLLAPYWFHSHYKIRSLDFFSRLSETVIWHRAGERRKLSNFTFALLDGDHNVETVVHEVLCLLPLMRPGGSRIVIDNCHNDDRTIPVMNAFGWNVEWVQMDGDTLGLIAIG